MIRLCWDKLGDSQLKCLMRFMLKIMSVASTDWCVCVCTVQVHGSKHSQLSSCFKYLLKEGGIRSLWRGNGINVLKIAPESAIKFAAYEQGKRLVLQFGGSRDRELTIVERFVAGSFAGGISQSVIYPLEVRHSYLAWSIGKHHPCNVCSCVSLCCCSFSNVILSKQHHCLIEQ